MFDFLKRKKKSNTLGRQLPDNGHEFYLPHDGQINPCRYLWAKHGCAVSTIHDYRYFDVEKLTSYLAEHGGIVLESISKTDREEKPKVVDMFGSLRSFESYDSLGSLWLLDDNLVNLQCESEGFRVSVYYPSGTPSIYDRLKGFAKERAKESRVSLLLSRNGNLCVESIDCKAPIIDDMDIYYGEGFSGHYEKIKSILDSNRPGLINLTGSPGTGKTTLIKYLTSVIDREFIFIPVNMIGRLADPDFLSLLLYHKGAVLVLEDAEQALQSREKDSVNSSVVATLLNLSDGLMGALLNVTIIATYNADKQFIDKALLRKGRLLFSHTFRTLTVEESKRLAKHLKKNIIVDKDTSIADIFNSEDNTGYIEPEHEKDKVMGFGAVMKSVKK